MPIVGPVVGIAAPQADVSAATLPALAAEHKDVEAFVQAFRPSQQELDSLYQVLEMTEVCHAAGKQGLGPPRS